jgi:hypothetical protein
MCVTAVKVDGTVVLCTGARNMNTGESAPHILILSTTWWSIVRFISWSLYTNERSLKYPVAVWFPDTAWMLWRRKLPLATAQQFTGHTSHSLDPESVIIFCLKEASSNKSFTFSKTAFVFPNENIPPPLFLSV